MLLADLEYGLIDSSLEYVTAFSDRYLMELMEYHMVLYDKLRETAYLFLTFYCRAYHHILKFDSRKECVPYFSRISLYCSSFSTLFLALAQISSVYLKLKNLDPKIMTSVKEGGRTGEAEIFPSLSRAGNFFTWPFFMDKKTYDV